MSFSAFILILHITAIIIAAINEGMTIKWSKEETVYMLERYNKWTYFLVCACIYVTYAYWSFCFA